MQLLSGKFIHQALFENAVASLLIPLPLQPTPVPTGPEVFAEKRFKVQPYDLKNVLTPNYPSKYLFIIWSQ